MRPVFEKTIKTVLFLISLSMLNACAKVDKLQMEVYQTSADGKKMEKVEPEAKGQATATILLKPQERFQKITGFGGSFTEASAHLLNQLSEANRNKEIEAYFGWDGARYSLTRTHMNSCDFSLGQYS